MVDFTTHDPIDYPAGTISEINNLVSITYSATDGTYTLNDAIVVLAEQYAAMTPTDIQAEEQRRWDEWIAIVNPPSEVIVDG